MRKRNFAVHPNEEVSESRSQILPPCSEFYGGSDDNKI